MRNERIADNLLDAKVAGINEYGCVLRGSDVAPLKQLEIVLFSVREIERKDFCIILVNHYLCLDCVTLLFARIVMFLAVFTILCLFFSDVLWYFLMRLSRSLLSDLHSSVFLFALAG